MADYFCARVSALKQHLDRQLVAANGRGTPSANVFTEKLSGKDTKRPKLQRLMATVQSGDTVAVVFLSERVIVYSKFISGRIAPQAVLIASLAPSLVSSCPPF